MSTKTIPVGLTAAQVLDGITAKAFTKTAAIAYLTARCDAAVAAGRIPKLPSVKALEALGKPFEYDRDEQRTRKQIAKGTATLAVRKAAPKRTKAKRKPANARRRPVEAGQDIAALIEAHGAEGVMAAFLKIASK